MRRKYRRNAVSPFKWWPSHLTRLLFSCYKLAERAYLRFMRIKRFGNGIVKQPFL